MSLSDTLGLPPSDGEFMANLDMTLGQLLRLMAEKQMTHVLIPLCPAVSRALHLTITVSEPAQSRAITHAIVGILGKK